MRTLDWPESNDQHSIGMYNSPKENYHKFSTSSIEPISDSTSKMPLNLSMSPNLNLTSCVASVAPPLPLRWVFESPQGTAEGWPWLRFNGWKASNTWPINDENRRTVRHSRTIDSVFLGGILCKRMTLSEVIFWWKFCVTYILRFPGIEFEGCNGSHWIYERHS